MIYFTSDLHLFHNKVIGFCQRPFADLDEMHEEIIRRFNAKVKPEDTTIFVGDITFGNTKKTKEIINRLNGRKIAVLGNHDPNPGTMMNMGFDLAVYRLEMLVRGKKVVISHYPFKPSLIGRLKSKIKGLYGKGDYRYMERRIKDDGQTFLIHGHTHSKKRFEGRALHVGVDAFDFTPVPMWEIEKHIDRELSKSIK